MVSYKAILYNIDTLVTDLLQWTIAAQMLGFIFVLKLFSSDPLVERYEIIEGQHFVTAKP